MVEPRKPSLIPLTAAAFSRPGISHQLAVDLPTELRSLPFISKRSADVATGTVKWFNSTKGYGFIQPDNGGKDIFVHISAVEKAGFSGLAEGAKVSYEVVTDRGKESAGNLRL